MRNNSSIRLLAILVLTVSLIAFPATVRADPAPLRGTTGTQWFPAGPNIDKLQINVYTDELSEYQNGLQGKQIDLTDWTVPATVSGSIVAGGSGFYLTAPNSEFGMFDIDINHANTFFGIPGSFGQDGITAPQCPTFAGKANDCTAAMQNFLQGIAHLIDKAAFITAAPTIAGKASPLDSAIPPGQSVLHSGLPINAQNPPSSPTCAPSSTIACATGTATGSYTTTAVDSTGASSSVTVGGVCGWDLLNSAHTTAGQTCQSAYKYASDTSTNGIVNVGQVDFCDAADHFIAAGLATTKSATDCHLTNFAPLAGGASSITFAIRSDSPPRLLLGDTLLTRMCDLISGPGNPCSQVVARHENIVQALGDVFSTRSVLLGWHMYTAGWGLGSQFDQLFALYNSAFSSSGCIPSQHTVSFGQDYVYFCNTAYDAATGNSATGSGLEFANSFSVAVQQAQVAMDIFGSHVATIPVWSGAIQFGYVIGWINVNDATGVGPPNGFTLLNTWSRTPASAGTLRWGFKQGTGNLNPYLFTTVWEAFVVSEVYDTLLASDPYNPSTLFGWMVNSFQPGNAAGTSILMNMKPGIFFHDGTRVTANDVKFSLLSFQQAGGSVAGAVANVADVRILAPPAGTPLGSVNTNFFIDLLHSSPFANFNIGGVPIVPSHIWAVDKVNPCITKGTPACTLDTTLLSGAAADPIVNHNFIGSGPFQCVDLVSGAIGGGCTQTAAGGPGTQAVDVGGHIVLVRSGGPGSFVAGNTAGFAGTDPLHSYFRGSAHWKQWLWADTLHLGTVTGADDVNYADQCDGHPATFVPLGRTTDCTPWDTTAVYLANPSTGAACTTASATCNIPCFSAAGSCNPGSIVSLGGVGSGVITSGEDSQVRANYGQTWTGGVSSYTLFTGALPQTGTIYEGGVSYCAFPLPSGQTTCP